MAQGNVQQHALDAETLSRGTSDSKPTPVAQQCEAGRAHALHIKRRSLGIVFVPGIMASRLADENDDMVWDPDSILTMLKFLFAGPGRRQELLLPEDGFIAPPRTTEKNRGSVPKRFPHAVERGWHTVAWDYFGELLQSLEEWETPLKAFIDMTVYAFGYNWLQSNGDSAKILKNFVEELTKKHDKILMISHSMGGLVTRAFIAGFGKEKILGVIHGAQPAMGAPAAYRRQKAGFEAHGFMDSIISMVLGNNGPKVNALFPFASGPLELLPCQFYNSQKGSGGWFSYYSFEKGEVMEIAPTDVYKKIYTKYSDECFFGMLEREPMYGQKYDTPRPKDIKKILDAQTFHATLKASTLHPNTIQLFGSGSPTCCAVHWHGTEYTDIILKHDFDSTGRPLDELWGESIRSILPRPVDGKNDYFELRWLDQSGKVGDRIITSCRAGKFVWGKNVQNRIKEENLRVALYRLTKPSEGNEDKEKDKDKEKDLTLQRSYTGETSPPATTHWDPEGDGTVPDASVLGLPVTKDSWPEALRDLLPTHTTKEGKTFTATEQSNSAEHTKFFEEKAIRSTQKAIHNLCVAWLKGDIT